jgi:hypothetical protein
MNEIVADDRQGHRQQREQRHGEVRVGAVQIAHGLRGQELIEGVEADVGNQRDAPHQQGAHVPELGTRLNHLRQAQLRTLGGMKGHEKRAEGGPEHHGDGGPHEISAEHYPHHPGGNSRQVSISRKPHRP